MATLLEDDVMNVNLRPAHLMDKGRIVDLLSIYTNNPRLV
jgi:hypothetical protein